MQVRLATLNTLGLPMKRDLKLVEVILSAIENTESGAFTGSFNFGDTYSLTQIKYHEELLKQAGYIQIEWIPEERGHKHREATLTWQGHDYLEQLRIFFAKQALGQT